MTRPAIIYCRYSPRPTDGEQTLITQEAYCREFCAARGWQIVGVECDEQASGRSREGRPGLARALAQAKQQKAVIVVYSLSRFARNTVEALQMVEELDRAGAAFAARDTPIDTTGPMGRLVLTILAAVAQLEREVMADRTKDALRRRARDGKRVSRHAPMGHRHIDGYIVPDAQELAAIERVRELKAQGRSLNAIARMLNDEGAPCRGRRWYPATVKRCLEQPERIV
jgi:site-specific DNA recombinase